MDGDFYESVAASLPPARFAFAYGSAVMPQSASQGWEDARGKMVDFILAVDDPAAWHAANLTVHRAHYSFLGSLGPNAVSAVQRVGAGVYFNTSVPFPAPGGPRLVKYGVVSSEDLLADLTQWTSLYVSGRLHKPVCTLRTDGEVETARAQNLRAALGAALLSLPGSFQEEALYAAVSALSYTGDVRMGIAEDPGKVGAIVRHNLERFRELYAEPLAGFAPHVHGGAGAPFALDASPEATRALVGHLPTRLQRGIAAEVLPGPAVPGAEVAGALAEVPRPRIAAGLQSRLVATVRRASRAQTAKGVLTAGVATALRYAARKVGKAWA